MSTAHDTNPVAIEFPLINVLVPPEPVNVALPALSNAIKDDDVVASVREVAVRVRVAGEVVPADNTTEVAANVSDAADDPD